MSTDYDSPWKEAISLYFRDFLRFFFPEIHDDVDWERGYEFLESELRAIAPDAEHGLRQVDALVRVQRVGGQTQIVLIHIEVQSQVDRGFPSRMKLYYTRLCDRFGQEVCSLAILGDGQKSWRPRRFQTSIWGCRMELSFPMRKLLDYPNWASGAQNPFAWLTAAHLQALATRRHPQKRAEVKFRLIRGLYECGLERIQVQALFRLLDWILALPEPLEYNFRQDLTRLEKENKMPYITSVERIIRKEVTEECLQQGLQQGLEQGLQQGLEQGLQQGLQQGQLEQMEQSCHTLRSVILSRHQQRWGELAPEWRARLQANSDLSRLGELLAELMVAPSSEDWARTL